ncbi:MAG TPA: sigma-70 family RNA polymerase sigma factor [Acidimicrobiales bacterium]|nr:sigma-70 family RNA polymerase sigma factor [Acidimicrobiales bacterium]
MATVVSGGGRVPEVRTDVATDKELVLAFQAGSCSAFAEIYRRHRGSAEAVCRRYLHPVDVEDAVQETMLRALQGLTQFNGDYAVRAWINRIAVNICLDVLRKRHRWTREQWPLLATSHDPEVVDPSETVESVLEAEEVGVAFARLPDRQQRALFLRGVEGQSHAQIATTLGISAPQAKAIIHRARVALRRDGSGKGWGRGALALLPWRNHELRGIFKGFPQLREPMVGVASSPAFAQSANDGYSVLATAAMATVATVVGAGAVFISPELRDPDGPARQNSHVEYSVATARPADILTSASTGEVTSGGRASYAIVGPGPRPSEPYSVTACDPEVEPIAEQEIAREPQCSSAPPIDGSQLPAAPTATEVLLPGPGTTAQEYLELDLPLVAPGDRPVGGGMAPRAESSPVPRHPAPAVKAVSRSARSLPATPTRPPVAGPRPEVSAAATRRTEDRVATTQAPVVKPPPARPTAAVVPADVPEDGAEASTDVPSLATP